MSSSSGGKGSWAAAILDEISLEGLDGVTLPTLWVLLSVRLECPLPLPEKFKQEIWRFILFQHKKLQFFVLPEERPVRKLYSRYDHLDEQLGVPVVPDENPYQRYKFEPLQDGHIFGSCADYLSRKELSIKDLHDLETVLNTWGSKLVIVASQDLRYDALTPPNVPRPKELTTIQYAIWELIGRARYNGETTSGPWSMLCFLKDSSIMFYLKNKLIRLNVLAQLLFTEKRNGRYMESTLLTLPRFVRARKSYLEIAIEKVYIALKSQPSSYRMSSLDMRDLLAIEKLKSIRKIMLTHEFRQVFDTNTKKRGLTYITLRYPNKSLEEVLLKASDDEKTEKQIVYLSNKHAFSDMPLEEEAYRAVVRHGVRGISLPEFSHYLGVQHLTARTLIKYLQREQLIKSYNENVGRQRLVRYVAAVQAEHISKDEEANELTLQNLKCVEEPNIPTLADVVLADVPAVSAVLKPMLLDFKSIKQDKSSKRRIERQKVIVNYIDEKCVAQMTDIRTAIQEKERAEGFTDEVCRKSIFRLLQLLCENRIINCYELTLTYKDHIRLYRFVTHPKIDIDHEILKNEVLRLKNYLYLLKEERNVKEKQIKQAQAKFDEKNTVSPYKTKPPKLFLARELHQFLYYILMELQVNQTPVEMSEELLQQWQCTEPELNVREYMEQWTHEDPHAVPYSDEINWRTFIPPLPRYDDKPAGWVLLKDAVERIPLSVFNKLFRIERYSDSLLQSYLKHPVRQHYLMRQLPLDSQCLITRLKLKNLYISTLRLLTHMGLVQVSSWKTLRDPILIWIYVNRFTSMLDTTSSELGYAKINAAREYSRLKFDFMTREDVVQYWTHLQRICIYTKLGFRRKLETPPHRTKYLGFLREVQFDEAQLCDNGEVPGDHLGAAGLGSHLYAYQFRHWSWMVMSKERQSIMAAKMRISSLSDVARLKQRKIRANLPPVRRAKKSATKVRNDPNAGSVKRASKKSGPRDDIDRDALKNMRNLRATWTKEEDTLLKMGRAVYLFMSLPLSVLGLLQVGRICRDIIRSYLGICNKTIQACVRRIAFIIKMKRDIPEVPHWLHLLQSNNKLSLTYNSNFLAQLKQEYTDKSERSDAATVHFILILHTLNEIVNNASPSAHVNFKLPDTLAEFNKSMHTYMPKDEDDMLLHHANPKNERDLKVTMAQSVLHCTLCCARDKTLYNLQAFEIYKNFSEDVLNATFLKSRAEALVISLKRRNMQANQRQIASPAFFLSSKYKYRLTYLKIPYTIYDGYLRYAHEALSDLYSVASTSEDIAGQVPYLTLKSPHFAQLLYLGESLACNKLDIDIKMPVNILTVDTTVRPNITTTDRILDHFSTILDNAPQTEYAKQLEHDGGASKQIRVKFQPANLSYKVFYSPYDFISKLQQRCLHFFCALDHLNQPVDINFNKLLQSNDDDATDMIVVKCPFNCILKGGNYINAIERIVHEKKATLKELSDDMTPQKLLNQATSANVIVVQPTNLLTLVRMLETFWQEKEQLYDRKDFGRVALSSTHKVIDWQRLCTEIIDFKPSDCDTEQTKEYEPTLNKEERARAQDVFVISLPTMELKLSDQLLATEQPMVDWHGLNVPQLFVETDFQQKAILDKVTNESYWKYTEHTFETLRPILDSLNYNKSEQQHMADILAYIETEKLGVSVQQLKERFPFKKFMLDALHQLMDHYLIKRVGVSSFLYVHKAHMRDWIVHTFHIKRLERERLFDMNTVGIGQTNESKCQKRKHEQPAQEESECEENEDLEASTSDSAKKMKLVEDDVASTSAANNDNTVKDTETNSLNELPTETSKTEQRKEASTRNKRTPKAVQRYDDVLFPAKSTGKGTTLFSEIARDVIVMRPQPWMRVNGSINRRVLDRWLSSLLSECISRTGCIVYSLFVRFPHMLPVDIMFLLELLCDMNCIHLVEMHTEPVTLVSSSEEAVFKEELVTEFYEPERTYVVTHSDAVGRLSHFIGFKKYKAEFF